MMIFFRNSLLMFFVPEFADVAIEDKVRTAIKFVSEAELFALRPELNHIE